ncbi:ribonuclease E/G, partial [Candidatus Synechococcus spongiarum]|uniref:ribonuclease E/G n=1 Tax=Candidatus Synechococcus spongiarum TaxID=431041 RepID=UPI00046EBF09
MTKQILIAEKLRIAAILNDERVEQLIVAQGQHQIGDIYLGMVENVHPGIDAAFVKVGESERNGFIHVTDLGPLRLRQTAGSITELLEPRQKALVQVMKEPTGNKGPRLTGNITLPGRFLVLQPNGRGVNISRRIQEEGERDRLRALAVLIKPAGTGLLVRTKAEGVGEDQIIDDLEALCRQWETVQAAAETAQPPALLNRDDDFVHRTLRDHCSPDLDKIVVDGPQVAGRVKAFLGVEKNATAVDSFASAEELMEAFRINAAIRQALLPRVDLPSGGYVVIEPTEALTVIDVNSGSF